MTICVSFGYLLILSRKRNMLNFTFPYLLIAEILYFLNFKFSIHFFLVLINRNAYNTASSRLYNISHIWRWTFSHPVLQTNKTNTMEKLVPTFPDRGCCVVSVAYSYGRFLNFSRLEPVLFLPSSSNSLVLRYWWLSCTSICLTSLMLCTFSDWGKNHSTFSKCCRNLQADNHSYPSVSYL
jgi:hypothetical protein